MVRTAVRLANEELAVHKDVKLFVLPVASSRDL